MVQTKVIRKMFVGGYSIAQIGRKKYFITFNDRNSSAEMNSRKAARVNIR